MLFPYGRVVGHMITVLICWDLTSWIWRISGETDAAASYGTHKIRSAVYYGILLLIVMKIYSTPCRSIAGIAGILQPAWNTQAKTSGSKNTGILLLLPACWGPTVLMIAPGTPYDGHSHISHWSFACIADMPLRFMVISDVVFLFSISHLWHVVITRNTENKTRTGLVSSVCCGNLEYQSLDHMRL